MGHVMVFKSNIFKVIGKYTLVIFIGIFILTIYSSARPTLNNILLELPEGTIYYKNIFDVQENSVQLVYQNNTNNINYLIDEIDYFGEQGNIEDAFILTEQGTDILYILLKNPIDFNTTGIPYASDLFSTHRYIKTKNSFVIDNSKLRNFFGEGADVGTISEEGEILRGKEAIKYTYPYKNKLSIIDIITKDNLYNLWSKYNEIELEILESTMLQEVPNYIESEKRVVKKGTKVSLKDISGGWLLVEYKNHNNLSEVGWVVAYQTKILSYQK